MTGFQQEKQLVRTYYAELERADGQNVGEILSRYLSDDHEWLGYHPFGTIERVDNLASKFWSPLLEAVTSVQRRIDIFFAGDNHLEVGGRWVVSMGHLMGLFDRPWLGIRPTGKLIMLRYAEFMRIENGKIVQTAMYFDLPHFMAQAGCNPFPPQTGAELVQPGPRTNDGLLFDEHDPGEGEKTLELIETMGRHLGQWDSPLSLEEELRQTWAEDMLWWGPTGIGSTYTISRYAKQHSGPFRGSFGRRSKTSHISRFAEGNYGGFFGRPNFKAEHRGGFMGMPASPKSGDFNVVDIYRRDGDKLAENWVFIDLLGYWHQMGVDLLKRAIDLQEGPK